MTEKIQSITSIEELDGYEAEAKRRGISGEELNSIYQKRRELAPKAKGGRK